MREEPKPTLSMPLHVGGMYDGSLIAMVRTCGGVRALRCKLQLACLSISLVLEDSGDLCVFSSCAFVRVILVVGVVVHFTL